MGRDSPPFFSVVVPTFQRAGLIGNTLESLLCQTFSDFEIIVVDDGGKDDTRSVVESFGDPRLRYHWKENGERGAARNYGAAMAKGEYLNFFDSDDLALPHHLQTAKDVIESNGRPEFVHLAFEVRKPTGERVHAWAPSKKKYSVALLDGNFFWTGCVFLSRGLAARVPFHEDRRLPPSEDWLCWLLASARSEPVVSTKVCAHVVDHPARSMAGSLKAKALSVELVEKYALKDPVFREKHQGRLGRFRAYVAAYAAMCLAQSKKSRLRALKNWIKAFAAYPPIVARRTFWAAFKHWF